MSLLAWEEKDKPLLLAIDSCAPTQEILDLIASNPSAARDEKSDNAGLIPLHAAVIKRCDSAVIKAILAANPESIHMRHPYENQTALHMALSEWSQISIPDQKVNEEVVLLLLAADTTAAGRCDNRGNLPIHYAVHASLNIVKAVHAAYPDGVKKRQESTWGSQDSFPYQLARDEHPYAPQEVQEYVLGLFPEAGVAVVYEADIGSYDR